MDFGAGVGISAAYSQSFSPQNTPRSVGASKMQQMNLKDLEDLVRKSIKYAAYSYKHTKFEQCVKSCRQAILGRQTVCEKLDLDPDTDLQLTLLQRELARPMMAMENWEAAELCLVKVMGALDGLYDSDTPLPENSKVALPSEEDYQNLLGDLGFCQFRKAKGIKLASHQTRAYNDAVRTYTNLLGRAMKQVTGATASTRVVNTMQNLASLFISAGRFKDAKTQLDECIEAQKKRGDDTAHTEKLLAVATRRHQMSVITGAALRIQMMIRRQKASRLVARMKRQKDIIVAITAVAVCAATYGVSLLPESARTITEIEQMLRDLEMQRYRRVLSGITDYSSFLALSDDDLTRRGVRAVDLAEMQSYAMDPEKYFQEIERMATTASQSTKKKDRDRSMSLGDLQGTPGVARKQSLAQSMMKKKDSKLATILKKGSMSAKLKMMSAGNNKNGAVEDERSPAKTPISGNGSLSGSQSIKVSFDGTASPKENGGRSPQVPALDVPKTNGKRSTTPSGPEQNGLAGNPFIPPSKRTSTPNSTESSESQKNKAESFRRLAQNATEEEY